MTSIAGGSLSPRFCPELIPNPEWHSLCTCAHSALLEGPEQATERVLLLLEPYLRAPVIWRRGHSRLLLPEDGGSLVVRNVSALDRAGQAVLLRWLDVDRTQVIATSVRPLFPLIASGHFDEALYYRLNVVLLTVADCPPPNPSVNLLYQSHAQG